MNNKLHHKGQHHLIYNENKWVKKDTFDIQNYISENVTLMQLMDTLVNLIHAISTLGYWIFDSKYEKALHLKRE